MSIVDWCLRIALRRWPEALREERASEWAAELHMLRGAPWARLRFAWSLAWSPPVEDEGIPRGWRESLPGLGRALQPMLALAAPGAGVSGAGAPGAGVSGAGVIGESVKVAAQGAWRW